jgi:hypothetical protein
MIAAPLFIFVILCFVCREELGWKGILICIFTWLSLLIVFRLLNISPYFFVMAEVLLDIVIILYVFGGDITIK